MPYKVSKSNKTLIAVDCIILGFDGLDLKILLFKRKIQPEKGKWSLLGGFMHQQENLDITANRVLFELTGLNDIYMEQIQAYSKLDRDPVERVVSVTYFALIKLDELQKQIAEAHNAFWFPVNEIPELIFDHNEMVELAKERLRNRTILEPIIFELLPEKFTIPQLHNLYESIYNIELDKRNFSKKMLSTKMFIKLKEKQKDFSKRGAFYHKLKKDYQKHFNGFFLKPKSIDQARKES